MGDTLGIQTEKNTFSNDIYECAVYATQGYRDKMEDRNLVCLSLPNHPEYSIFGIFDGFNGIDASCYLSQNILSELDKLSNLDDNDLIISLINELDKQWLEQKEDSEINCNKNAGSTILFALIKRNELQSNEFIIRIFWAGDSRAVALIKNDENNKFEQKDLTIDHHCDLEEEVKRIKNANGEIINDRIDGIVAITRCFGCYPMKNNNDLSFNEQKMISLVECNEIICKTDDILLIFCDGLVSSKSNNLNNLRLINNYKYQYEQHHDEKNGILNCLIYLVEESIDSGSKDNISIISVQFKSNINNNKSYFPSLSTGIYGNYLYLKQLKLFKLKYIMNDNMDLTNDEKTKIMNFGNILQSKYGYIEDIDYSYSDLIRFVIGNKMRLNVAEEKFLNFKKLELEYNLNNIEFDEIGNELKKECYILCGHDLSNNKMIGFKINKFVNKTMNIGVIIKSIHYLLDAITLNIDILRNGIVILFDCNGINKKNMSLDLEKIFIKSFQNCYPLKIKQFIIINAPIIIRAAIQISKLMLSKKLSSRIISVKSNLNGGDLWKFVKNDQVPKCLNGTFKESINAQQFVWSKIINHDIDEKQEEQ